MRSAGRESRGSISPSPAHREQGETLGFFETPTADAVQVRVEGQVLFELNTAPRVLSEFYRRFGVRTFDGLHPYDGLAGWRAFLKVQFQPLLKAALREAIGRYRCIDLVNTCAYVQGGVGATGTRQPDGDNSEPRGRTTSAGIFRRRGP